MRLRFEWDADKAEENLRKHGVAFSEAATVLDDPLAITYPDPEHSEGEVRSLTFGLSSSARLLVVSHTETADTLRILSARLATRPERKIYEEG